MHILDGSPYFSCQWHFECSRQWYLLEITAPWFLAYIKSSHQMIYSFCFNVLFSIEENNADVTEKNYLHFIICCSTLHTESATSATKQHNYSVRNLKPFVVIALQCWLNPALSKPIPTTLKQPHLQITSSVFNKYRKDSLWSLDMSLDIICNWNKIGLILYFTLTCG